MPGVRLSSRLSLLQQLESPGVRRQLEQGTQEQDRHRREAAQVLAGGARTAFDLRREPPAVRDRYGRNKWGQSVLLARRLVEAGVRMVFVNWPRDPGDLASASPLWDTHAKNDARMKDVLCPQFDQGFTALIDDLQQRGLLDETLVVSIGEMGRTPRFNTAGRPRSLGKRLQLRDGRRRHPRRAGLRIQRRQGDRACHQPHRATGPHRHDPASARSRSRRGLP